MTFSKKLAQQQLLKARNETRFSSLSVPSSNEPLASPPVNGLPTIQSGLEKLRRRFRAQPSEDYANRTLAAVRPQIPQESLDGQGSFLRRVSHSPLGADEQEIARIGRLIQLLCVQERSFDFRSILFVDTETTGLSGGAGTVAFLVGVGRWTDSGFVVEQYLMRDYPEERAMLLGLQERFADAQALVTFNGKAFDIPLLQSRFVLARRRWPLAGAVHLDLLHPARRMWKLRLGRCCLANLENSVLGIERKDDIPGHLIPHVYFRYVRTGSPHGIASVLSHNRQDIETLARLTLRMAMIFSGEASHQLEPVDLFSAGRYAHALGKRELAMNWNEAALVRGLPEAHEMEARRMKAAQLKGQKRYSEAAELWRALSERSEVFLEDIQEELAMYYEHREGDLQEALSVSERALIHLENQAAIRKWEHRRARVAMKLARRKQVGTDFLFDHRPSS